MGPLGANGLANSRDFEYPIASFDVDRTPWSGEPHVLACISLSDLSGHSHLQVRVMISSRNSSKTRLPGLGAASLNASKSIHLSTSSHGMESKLPPMSKLCIMHIDDRSTDHYSI